MGKLPIFIIQYTQFMDTTSNKGQSKSGGKGYDSSKKSTPAKELPAGFIYKLIVSMGIALSDCKYKWPKKLGDDFVKAIKHFH